MRHPFSFPTNIRTKPRLKAKLTITCVRARVCAKLTKVVVRERRRGISQKCIVVQSLIRVFGYHSPATPPRRISAHALQNHPSPTAIKQKAKREKGLEKRKNLNFKKREFPSTPTSDAFFLLFSSLIKKRKNAEKKRKKNPSFRSVKSVVVVFFLFPFCLLFPRRLLD